MKVFYKKDVHVIIQFPSGELKQALGVLKALAKHFKAGFIFRVAEDLEQDLTPRVTYENHIHICENCCTEMDDRKGNWVHVHDSWLHVSCPVLKSNRPV